MLSVKGDLVGEDGCEEIRDQVEDQHKSNLEDTVGETRSSTAMSEMMGEEETGVTVIAFVREEVGEFREEVDLFCKITISEIRVGVEARHLTSNRLF